jgi:hypothetical protein
VGTKLSRTNCTYSLRHLSVLAAVEEAGHVLVSVQEELHPPRPVCILIALIDFKGSVSRDCESFNFIFKTYATASFEGGILKGL